MIEFHAQVDKNKSEKKNIPTYNVVSKTVPIFGKFCSQAGMKSEYQTCHYLKFTGQNTDSSQKKASENSNLIKAYIK